MEKKDNKYFIIIGISILCIIVVLIYGVYRLLNRKSELLRIDSTKEIVYTYYESDIYDQTVPIINLVQIDSAINQEIMDFYEPYMELPSVTSSYSYSINGKILSLLLLIGDFNNDHCIDYHFKTIHINLESFSVLTNEDILKYFNYTQEIISTSFDQQFQHYYQDEINRNYLSSETSYKEFLEMHQIENWDDVLYYYIEDGKLIALLDYFEYPEQEKENYFKNIGFQFEI